MFALVKSLCGMPTMIIDCYNNYKECLKYDNTEDLAKSFKRLFWVGIVLFVVSLSGFIFACWGFYMGLVLFIVS